DGGVAQLAPGAGRQVVPGGRGQHQQAGDVTAQQHEAVVTEREDAGDAVDEVEADGGDAPDGEQRDHLLQLGAGAAVHQPQREDRQHERAGGQQPVAGHQPRHHTFSDRSSPTMPLGRKSRMMMSTAKANVSLYSVMPGKSAVRGNSAVRKFSRNPSRTPPTTAPGRLPMPPMTAAANALMPGRIPK